jgi:predicted CoA-binding protein
MTTAVIGASPNPSRYSNFASNRLLSEGHQIVPLGIKKGMIADQNIIDIRNKPDIRGIHTITIYLSERNQKDWEDYILSLEPERIIFNPGAENISLTKKALEKGIEVQNACTLVMLNAGTY